MGFEGERPQRAGKDVGVDPVARARRRLQRPVAQQGAHRHGRQLPLSIRPGDWPGSPSVNAAFESRANAGAAERSSRYRSCAPLACQLPLKLRDCSATGPGRTPGMSSATRLAEISGGDAFQLAIGVIDEIAAAFQPHIASLASRLAWPKAEMIFDAVIIAGQPQFAHMQRLVLERGTGNVARRRKIEIGLTDMAARHHDEAASTDWSRAARCAAAGTAARRRPGRERSRWLMVAVPLIGPLSAAGSDRLSHAPACPRH